MSLDDDTAESLQCVDCLRWLPPDGFHRERNRPTGRHRRCKDCRNARNRAHVARDPQRRAESMKRWRDAHPAEYARSVRAWKMRKYGLDLDTYERLLVGQDGVCAICRRAEPAGGDLSVDHDHDTGAVRGLLCRTCNMSLGLLRDDPELLRRAAEYLLR